MIITIKIPLPDFHKLRREPKRGDLIKVACYHCGKVYDAAMKNIRVGNYWSTCR